MPSLAVLETGLLEPRLRLRLVDLEATEESSFQLASALAQHAANYGYYFHSIAGICASAHKVILHYEDAPPTPAVLLVKPTRGATMAFDFSLMFPDESRWPEDTGWERTHAADLHRVHMQDLFNAILKSRVFLPERAILTLMSAKLSRVEGGYAIFSYVQEHRQRWRSWSRNHQELMRERLTRVVTFPDGSKLHLTPEGPTSRPTKVRFGLKPWALSSRSDSTRPHLPR